MFADPETLSLLGPALAQPFGERGITAVVAVEARGFVVGALCAEHLGAGLVLARKPGSIHPGDKVEVVSAPDWRGHEVVLRLARILTPEDRALLVDDWIETGSQARAVRQAVKLCGAEFVGSSVIVDGTTEEMRADLNVAALVFAADLRDA